LVGFNGECWQSFGLLLSFRNFDVDDIFFFATKLDAYISNDQELIDSVAKNPIPFFMLVVEFEIPFINERKKPNLVSMAKQSGIDYEIAKKLWVILKRQHRA
jgi:hypothetical protein